MDSYGLIVEGIFDESVFPEFIRKIVPKASDPVVRPCGGVSRLMKRFPGFLRDLERAREGGPVDKALVIRDWHEDDFAPWEQKMRELIQDRRFAFPRGIQFCGVRHEMEAWLLADESAISDVSIRRGGRRVAPVHGQIEEIRDPKEKLEAVLSWAGITYTAQVCAEIAQLAKIELLRYRCPSFRSFETRVLDC